MAAAGLRTSQLTLRPQRVAAPTGPRRAWLRVQAVGAASVMDTAAYKEAAEHLRLVGAEIGEGPQPQSACGLDEDEDEAAARMALAPPSVRAFIERWGKREGIDQAYTSECVVNWDVPAILESMEEIPGHHHETSAEAAFRAKVELSSIDQTPASEDPAARLVRAPKSVQEFIARWGRPL